MRPPLACRSCGNRASLAGSLIFGAVVALVTMIIGGAHCVDAYTRAALAGDPAPVWVSVAWAAGALVAGALAAWCFWVVTGDS